MSNNYPTDTVKHCHIFLCNILFPLKMQQGIKISCNSNHARALLDGLHH